MSSTWTDSLPNPRYYTVHSAEKKKVKAKDQNKADGCSMYRALARFVIGDPRQYHKILETVQHFAIRVRTNINHPLRSTYMMHETAHDAVTNQAIFSALDCPDLHPNEHVLWVVAHALKIQIRIFTSIDPSGEAQGLRLTAGCSDAYPHAILQESCAGVVPFRFASLLPDESGKELIEYLQETQERIDGEAHLPSDQQTFSGLQIKQMSWQFRPKDPYTEDEFGLDISCFNQWRPESKKDDLGDGRALNRLDAHTMVVNEPQHIVPALQIFKEALQKAPNQRRNVRVGDGCQPGIMLYHTGTDAEFVKYPREKGNNLTRDEANWKLATGEIEELCSVLTFAIDRHCFLIINILHMLETANELTVPALEHLFREILFDPKIVSFWWNYQSDFKVLDNTIAHMYQSTKREPFVVTPWRMLPRTVMRTFRISSPFLNGERPDWTYFPRNNDGCAMHLAGKNEYGMSCPDPTGNIDIAALLSHFCRQLGHNFSKLHWATYRHGVNYGSLLGMMLGGDRLGGVLTFMKDCAFAGPNACDFYQKLGKPGMEQDDFAMGYNIGDVCGVALIINLFSSDDKEFILNRLGAYAFSSSFAPRQVPQKESSLGMAGDITLIEDNPKVFTRSRGPIEDNEDEDQDVHSVLFYTWSISESIPASGLCFWEHDEFAKTSRDLALSISQAQSQYTGSLTPIQTQDERWAMGTRAATLLKTMLDPSRLSWPETCATVIEEEYPNPIVRAGTTQAEGLIEFLSSGHAAGAVPPPGFGAAPGSPWGLPIELQRTPGSSLPLARNIHDAFQGTSNINGDLLGLATTLPARLSTDTIPDTTPRQLAIKAIESQKSSDVWYTAASLRRTLKETIAHETRLNDRVGLPGPFDIADVLDPFGRHYRKAVEATPDWNRPDVKDLPRMLADGTCESEASLTLQGLDEIVPEEDSEGRWETVKGSRGKGANAEWWQWH